MVAMKSRPSRLGEQSRSTSSALSRSSWLATSASASVAVNVRWSLACVARPVALSVYATTPLPENASIAGPGGSVANSSASLGASRCLEPMNRIRGIGGERVQSGIIEGMDDKINLAEKFALLPDAYQPGDGRLHERLQAGAS